MAKLPNKWTLHKGTKFNIRNTEVLHLGFSFKVLEEDTVVRPFEFHDEDGYRLYMAKGIGCLIVQREHEIEATAAHAERLMAEHEARANRANAPRCQHGCIALPETPGNERSEPRGQDCADCDDLFESFS